MDETARQQLADALCSVPVDNEWDYTTEAFWDKTLDAVWPVVARLCEQARRDGRQDAARDIEAWDWQGDYAVAAIKSAVEGAARVARGDAP